MFFRRMFNLVAVASGAVAAHAATNELAWSILPPLPPAAGQSRQPGVASPFVGVHGNALIVAGGANFPEKMPWDGGAKKWWDDIWVLEKKSDGSVQWVGGKSFKLPRPVGYGASVSTPEGIVCAGGSDAERCYADVFLLSWDARAKEIRRTALPPMPEPLANMASALVGDTLYVAGGQHVMAGAVPTAVFWSLDLSQRNRPADFKWKVLPTWPGPPRVLAIAASGRSARGEEWFLFSGRAPERGKPTRLLTDAYAFDPKAGSWRTLASVNGGAGVCVMAGTTATVTENQILIFGGDRGDLFRELESHDLEIERLRAKATAETGAAERAKLDQQINEHLAAKRKIYETHPGFSREVLSYDPQRDAWGVLMRAPVALPVTTTAAKWGNDVIIPSGEIRPGVRTADVVRVGLQGR
jgi:solute:Na+ symporter, SSS family